MLEQVGGEMEAAEEALKKDWGDQFEPRMDIANSAVRHFGGDELVAEFKKTGVGRQPNTIKAFYALGMALQGDTALITGEGGGGAITTPEAAKAEIERIRAEATNDPKHPYNDQSHPESKVVRARMDELYKLAYPGTVPPG